MRFLFRFVMRSIYVGFGLVGHILDGLDFKGSSKVYSSL